ncbi:DUF1488 domain-containing protein [Janthinobacterium lividum]
MMKIEFPSNAGFDPSRYCVWFRAIVDGRTINCFITEEALTDHFTATGRDASNSVAAFETNRAVIEPITKSLIVQLGPDADILLKSEHF